MENNETLYENGAAVNGTQNMLIIVSNNSIHYYWTVDTAIQDKVVFIIMEPTVSNN